jgi:hypothetical protein
MRAWLYTGAEDDVGPSAIGQNGKAMQGGGREAEAVMAVRKAVGRIKQGRSDD